MDKLLYEEKTMIDETKCDMYGRLRADALFSLMQRAAQAHADLLGFGRAALLKSNTAWVLTHISVRLSRAVRAREELTLKTLPGEARAGLYRRHFEFFAGGERVGFACSLWAVIDLERRVILSPADAPELPAADYAALMDRPARVRLFEGEAVARDYVCVYSDADANRHINNAAYVRFLEDTFPANALSEAFISELDACYHRELPPYGNAALTLTRDGARFCFTAADSAGAAFSASGTLAKDGAQ